MAFSASAGSLLVIPHDEAAYGQEELYLVVEGRARFVCNGEETELGRVTSSSRRPRCRLP